ncbi:radical SAM protein [Selenomonas ruminantium]|uniref:radical SAM protein n=1 Tax=Selenomonas ruminantium TaxID=971 RepID=UPI000411718C|nr:radical SAM protein [Selenomonas ruminantium]
MSDKIFRQGAFETFYDMPIRVNWSLSEMCNYRCSYCFGKKKKIDKNKFSTLEEIKQAIKYISDLNRPSYDLTLAGGEPTIHPHFFDILQLSNEMLKERLNKILIITNGSNNNDLYDKLASISSYVNIKAQVSLHLEYVNMDHIIELVKLLSNKISLHFALMYHPEKQESVEDCFRIMLDLRKKYSFSMSVVMLRPTDKCEREKFPYDTRYLEKQFLWCKKANEEFYLLTKSVSTISHKDPYKYNIFYDVEKEDEREIVNWDEKLKNNFKEMFCLSGSHLLRIDPDGNVKGMVCWADKSKYNIFRENPYLHGDFIHVVKCPAISCGCSSNIYIPKFINRDEAEAFAAICREKQKRLLQ